MFILVTVKAARYQRRCSSVFGLLYIISLSKCARQLIWLLGKIACVSCVGFPRCVCLGEGSSEVGWTCFRRTYKSPGTGVFAKDACFIAVWDPGVADFGVYSDYRLNYGGHVLERLQEDRKDPFLPCVGWHLSSGLWLRAA